MALPIRRGNRLPASLSEPRHMMDPFRDFEEMWDRIGRQFMSPIFDRYLESGVEQQAGSWTPLIEVEETDEAYLVKAELPGLKREDIDLQVDEHTLSIGGEVRPEQHEKGQVLQRRSGRFFYRTALPRDVETDGVKAQMREGVLNIRMPKTKQATRRVQIESWAIAYRDPLEQLQREIDRMLESAFGSVGASAAGVYPPVNVFDAGEEYVIKAELPGVDAGKVEVNVENETVSFRGERTFDEPNRDVAYHRREREQGQFRRVVRIPGRLASETARAEYRDGVLTIRVPKAKETRPRRVEIQAD